MKCILIFAVVFAVLGLFGCASGSLTNPSVPIDAAKAPPTATSTTTQNQAAPEAKTEPEKKTATSPSSNPAGALSCMLEKDERVLELVGKDSGCELKYTKFGETNVIATSMNGSTHCEKVRDNIRANLERFQFKCDAK